VANCIVCGKEQPFVIRGRFGCYAICNDHGNLTTEERRNLYEKYLQNTTIAAMPFIREAEGLTNG